jgi:general stress protein 26
MKTSLIEMQEYLEVVRIPVRIACKTTTGWPTVISLWFLHQDGLLYCATQKSAKIVNYLRNDARCAFEIAEDQPPYCGIRGQAKARIDETLGAEILEKLLVRYLGDTDNELASNLLANSDTEIAIILDPMRIFTWDFSDRMAKVQPRRPSEKVCP